MANIKSSQKRAKQNEKRNELNSAKKSTIRTFEKKLRASVKASKLDVAKDLYKTFCSLIDKATKTNLVHKNKADRKKSRLAALLKNAAISSAKTN